MKQIDFDDVSQEAFEAARDELASWNSWFAGDGCGADIHRSVKNAIVAAYNAGILEDDLQQAQPAQPAEQEYREAFELHMCRGGCGSKTLLRDANGDYLDDEVFNDFVLWKAALSAQPAQQAQPAQSEFDQLFDKIEAANAQQAQPVAKPHLCGLAGLNVGLCADCAGIRAQQAQTAEQELTRLRKIAQLIGSIFVHGDFKAETYNERELEKLLREQGTFYETLADYDAQQAQPADAKEQRNG